MADIARSGGSGVAGIPGTTATTDKNPLAAVHDLQYNRMVSQKKDYADLTQAETTKIQIAGLEGLQTSFKCKRLVGLSLSEMSGRRISALSNGRCLSIVAICPAGSEAEMEPVFDKMLASLVVKEPGG